MSQDQQNDQKEFFDALENFKLAVFNGQLRLAFENLVPVIDGIVDVLSSEEVQDEPVQKQDQVKASEEKVVSKPSVKDEEKSTKKTQLTQSEEK